MRLSNLVLTMALIHASSAAAIVPVRTFPAMRYAGAWIVHPDKGPIAHLSNICAHGSVFVTCEQWVDSKVQSLLIFREVIEPKPGDPYYETIAISPDGSRPPAPVPLYIDSDRWTYTFDSVKDGRKIYGRVLNIFSGPDNIHYEVQSSYDGVAWTTTSSGDETREP